MQRDEQLITADDDNLIEEIAADLSIVKHTDDRQQEKELLKEALEDFLELIKRKCMPW